MFINNALADTDTITIQDTETTPEAPSSTESMFASTVPILLVFMVFYFLLIRPQEKKRRAQEDMVAGVKKGEEVLTTSGIYGTVTKINDSDNTIMLQIADKTEIKMMKSSIADILSRAKKDPESAKKRKEKKAEKK